MLMHPIPEPDISYSTYAQIAEFIRGETRLHPKVGLVFGSGLSTAAAFISPEASIPYAEIPGWPVSTVEGHPGKLIIGRASGKDVLAMQGRVHYLEGYRMEVVTLPVRVMRCLGIQILILLNSAGGVSENIHAGDLMLISDHINLLGMAGMDPLRGPNVEAFGPRYPEMSAVYDEELRDLAQATAAELDIPIKTGVYFCELGPSYSTPADLRVLRMLGADAVGMSTIPEAIVACHAGIRLLGISCITDTDVNPAHEQVLAKAEEMSNRLAHLLAGVVDRMTLN